MIYIVGTEFTVGVSNRSISHKTQSIQEMMAHQNRSYRPAADSKFKVGTAYKLVYIKKIDKEFKYTFEELPTKNLIDHTFNSTLEADNYIARLRNSTQELADLRNQIDTYASSAI